MKIAKKEIPQDVIELIMLKKWHQLRELIDKFSTFQDNHEALKSLNKCLLYIDPNCLKLLCEKFERSAVEIIKINNEVLYRFANDMKCHLDGEFPATLIENLQILTQSCTISETLVKNAKNRSFISFLYLMTSLPLDILTEIGSRLIKSGLKVSLLDLSSIYKQYGRCRLFEDMLQAKIDQNHGDDTIYHKYSALPFMLGRFITIEDLLSSSESNLELIDFESMLHYTALPKFKDFYFLYAFKWMLPEADRVLPKVPCLVELSRNSVHKYLIHRVKITCYKNYKRIVGKLPIPKRCEDILLYNTELY